MKKSQLSLALFVMLAVTGCAITPPTTTTEDKRVRLSTAVSTPGVDGTAVTAVSLCVLKRPGSSPPVVKPVAGQSFEALAAKAGPLSAVDDECAHHSVHIFANQPTGSAVITQGVPIAIGQIIQGEYAKDVARIGTCDNPAGCNNTQINVQGAQAQAVSSSNQTNTVDVKSTVKTGGPALCAGKTASECAALAK